MAASRRAPVVSLNSSVSDSPDAARAVMWSRLIPKFRHRATRCPKRFDAVLELVGKGIVLSNSSYDHTLIVCLSSTS